jgi:phosphinothricin acetyltransferase
MSYDVMEMMPDDWEQVAAIYREGIDTGNATFETGVPTRKVWNSAHVAGCSLVARSGDTVLGWAALSPTSGRRVYAGVAEVSVYVGEKHRSQGVGDTLLKALIDRSEDRGIWTLQAGIFPENKASVSLHKKNGFREVGIRERVGRMNGVWRDVLLMERRSKKVGNDED